VQLSRHITVFNTNRIDVFYPVWVREVFQLGIYAKTPVQGSLAEISGLVEEKALEHKEEFPCVQHGQDRKRNADDVQNNDKYPTTRCTRGRITVTCNIRVLARIYVIGSRW